MNSHDIAPRLGQVPGCLAAAAPRQDDLGTPARAGRSHAGRVVRPLASCSRPGECLRSQLVAPQPPASRDLSQRILRSDPAAH